VLPDFPEILGTSKYYYADAGRRPCCGMEVEPVGQGRIAMPTRLSVTEVARNLSEVLGRVRFRGERFLLLRGGKPVAELGPTGAAPPVRARDLPALLAALPPLEPDDAERFARDFEAVRVAGQPPATPSRS
jgi:antitoxin (DNA-binding transcriptional repressor) of toxin-antitoxin stability system